MCLFIETIRIEQGGIANAAYHNRRMNATRRAVWGEVPALKVEDIVVPPPASARMRCRLVYGRHVEAVEYFPYSVRPVRSLQLVRGDEVDYHFKYRDRSALDRLFATRAGADDILIVKNGLITDTSIANAAFWDGTRWYTPAHPLLRGTHRQALMDCGVLDERDITPASLAAYSRVRLFNALILFGEVDLPCDAIRPL